MSLLRIKKITDRTPVKITLSLPPETHSDLLKYAEIYRQEHSCTETPQVLAVHMITAFIQSDNGFKKAKQSL
ncbi:DUF2274 domain-containing protein [Paremcibacter congregatus]|uniref:Transposase n=1 Tax=Paremcibacter congregatus TaxID=2043170 RepID=A0A2G4YWP4_9PROT|nr:DUF2274 domain-containing protein [Paremcibacter congregatus]PHZ86751.1 transposase [Paremcibacter congregatus]QDE26291.1 DUF2274 domain-containing protein [Paremcibacter congregatus]QDE28003.1 DUF2274 domain-containing protein [Paremcibacter congregatus]